MHLSVMVVYHLRVCLLVPPGHIWYIEQKSSLSISGISMQVAVGLVVQISKDSYLVAVFVL